MSGAPVTLRDLARAARVSTTTASAALAGTGRVSASTRTRVAAAAAELGYVPNVSAQSLRRGRTGMVGLHVQEPTLMGTTYFVEFLVGAAAATHAVGVDLVLMTPEAVGAPVRPPRVDGVLIADPLADDAGARALLIGDLPVVVGELCPPGLTATATVAADHASGLTELLDHLVAVGARRPALLAPGSVSGWGVLLNRTYREWCHQRGIEPLVREIPFRTTDAGAHAATAGLLAACPDVDAVVCSSDAGSLGVLRAAGEAGRSVPGDLLVASCVDAPALEPGQASVTSLALHGRRLGARCAEVLLDLLGGATRGPEPDLLPVDLLVRASTTR